MYASTAFFFICAVAAANCAKLPSSFTKCHRKESNFGRCLAAAVENAVGQLDKQIKEVGLPNMEPLEVPALRIGAGTGPVAFEQNYKDVLVSGFTKLRCSAAAMDFAAKTLNMTVTIPQLKLEFAYEISGKILLLPIYGKGPGVITDHLLDELEQVLRFTFEEFEKKGKKHFRVVDSKLVMNPKLIQIKLDNLFNGDKALGDNINQVMNDNWAEVFADVKPSYEEAFAKIFLSIFNNLLAKVPISEIFGED
ncbi:unnamed protein product [Tenebrio molitor]|nr:unnamed protein product [Tenebrio molitor]